MRVVLSFLVKFTRRMESGWRMNVHIYGIECSADDDFLTAWRVWPWKSFCLFSATAISPAVSFVIRLPAFRIVSHTSSGSFPIHCSGFCYPVLFTCINLHLFSDRPDGMLPLWMFNNTFAKCHVDPFAPCLGEFRRAPPVHRAVSLPSSSISEFDLAYNEDFSFILDAEPAVQLPLSRLSFAR